MSKTAVATSAITSGLDQLGGVAGVVVAFVCENCGREGRVPSSGLRRRPSLPDFQWPSPVQEVAVPCAGRLQPEHLMKALEDGADAVGVICCADGNCHHVEGNRRCRRRLDYVAGLLEQIGLGKGRLAIFQLPGSAAEDMALGAGIAAPVDPAMAQKIATVRDAFAAWVAQLPRNPLAKGELPDESPYEVDSEDESDE
jgi:F420-non-reducing hydrogenase iron-sulfur subunit